MSNKLIKPWAHETCREAVRCVSICEKDSRYDVDMYAWHFPRKDGRCRVCAAGSWMAVTLNLCPRAYVCPWGLGHEIATISNAINGFCLSGLRLPIKILGQKKYYRNTIMDEWPDRLFYEDSPAKWKKELLKMADYLEENFLGEEKPQETREKSVYEKA